MNTDKRLEIIFNHIKNGVEFISTDNVFIDETVRIGKHTRIFPDVGVGMNVGKRPDSGFIAYFCIP